MYRGHVEVALRPVLLFQWTGAPIEYKRDSMKFNNTYFLISEHENGLASCRRKSGPWP